MFKKLVLGFMVAIFLAAATGCGKDTEEKKQEGIKKLQGSVNPFNGDPNK